MASPLAAGAPAPAPHPVVAMGLQVPTLVTTPLPARNNKFGGSSGGSSGGGGGGGSGDGKSAAAANTKPAAPAFQHPMTIPYQSRLWPYHPMYSELAAQPQAQAVTTPAAPAAPAPGSDEKSIAAVSARSREQSDWRWCHKCQALVYTGVSGDGVCAYGGLHDTAGSAHYTLPLERSLPPTTTTTAASGSDAVHHSPRPRFLWCSKCQCLIATTDRSRSMCAAESEPHDHAGSLDFHPVEASITAEPSPLVWFVCLSCSVVYCSVQSRYAKCPLTGRWHAPLLRPQSASAAGRTGAVGGTATAAAASAAAASVVGYRIALFESLPPLTAPIETLHPMAIATAQSNAAFVATRTLRQQQQISMCPCVIL